MSKMASKEPPKEEHLMTCDEIIKTCGSMEDKEKLKYFAAMYEKLYKLHRNLQFCYNTTKREVSSLNADKNKLVLVQSRLESLCRELQKQNKVIKDESLLKIREEEERRKQISQEFQKTLNNVTTMMTESNAQNSKLGEENRQMAERLASIYEEFKTRENEVERISKQIDIERQLAEARCAKMKTEHMIDKQTSLVEKDQLNQKIACLTKELLESTKKSTILESRIAELTMKLDSYSGRYEEFETTISRSGKVFDHCKSEITRMNKQINTLEKEIAQWQSRCHKNMVTIQALQSESSEKTKFIECVTRKQNQLAKLCRQLNSERKAYITVLKEVGKNPDDITIEPVEDEPELEYQPKKLLQTASVSSDEKPRPVPSQKKPIFKAQDQQKKKQRVKKGKEIPETTVPITLKEIQLAELKEELQRVQDQVSKIQSQSQTPPSQLPLPATKEKVEALVEDMVEQLVITATNEGNIENTNSKDLKTDERETSNEDIQSQQSCNDKPSASQLLSEEELSKAVFYIQKTLALPSEVDTKSTENIPLPAEATNNLKENNAADIQEISNKEISAPIVDIEEISNKEVTTPADIEEISNKEVSNTVAEIIEEVEKDASDINTKDTI